MNLNQIHESFFTDVSKPVASRRLCKLARHGYINRKAMGLDGRIRVIYDLHPKGLQVIKSDLDYEVTKKYYVSDSREHDLDLVEIDKFLNRCKDILKTYTESELQSCEEYGNHRDLRPFVALRSDRAVLVESQTGPVYAALEYERTVKSKSRMQDRIQDYYRRENIPVVFYVCKSQPVINALSKADAEVREDKVSKLYFAKLSSLKSAEHKATFHSPDGNQVNFIFKSEA